MNLRARLAVEWVATGFLATAVVVSAMLWRGTDSLDNLLYDRFSAAWRPVADKDILIVAIDDPSLKALGKWPWHRAVHTQLLSKLQAARPRSITFDVLLSEPSDPSTDASLANAMIGPAPVITPLHFATPGSDGRIFDTILPAPIFASAISGAGHVNVRFDDDGIVRRAALCFKPDSASPKWPHLIELAYRGRTKTPSPAFERDKNCGDELLIPYLKRDSFAVISYSDLLLNDLPDGMISGRDVIIGATAAGMGDNFPVPNGAGGLLPGVEVMANMLGAMRRDDFVKPLTNAWISGLSLLPLWLLLIGFVRWRPRVVLTMSLLSLAGILLSSIALLGAHLWFPPGAALLGVLLVYPLWGWRRLQAMSDFMATELNALEKENEATSLPIAPSRVIDMVGQQSESLAIAIDHVRDLRRFVADTLADLPDPMFVSDPDGNVTLANRLLDERFGWPILGMPVTAALDKMVAADHRATVNEYLGSDAARQSSEFVRFSSPIGRTFVMRRSEVRNDAGELHGHIHYLTDISALAKAEDEREVVLQLLSHDMRAPQSTIIALLDGEVDADAKKRIETNARRTMQLAQDFVDIARMGETQFNGDDVLLADLMRDSADNFWPLANERNIRITVNDESDSGFVIAETDTLCRAIANLIDNAIKFSPDGSNIAVLINRFENGSESWLSASITDQGMGISTEILPRLFSRFATGGENQGRVQGTGLGLTFVQAVIARHKGRIVAENLAGGGARFTFELPEAPDI